MAQVIKRKDKVYQVRVFLGRNHAGRRRFHTKTIHGTKKQAEAYAWRVQAQVDAGSFVPVGSQIGNTLGDYLALWLDTATHASDGAEQQARDQVRLYLAPQLGDIPLRELTPDHIEAAYARLADRLSPRSIRIAHAPLRKALDRAVRQRRIDHNPAALVDFPRQSSRHKGQALSAGDAHRLLEACEGHPLRALFVVMLACGLRPGEAYALTWQDVDWEDRLLRVDKSLTRRNDSSDWRIKETKTPQGRRVIPLPPVAIEALHAHRRGGQAPAIADIAKACGIAKSTASMALRGDGRIAEATRRQVTQVASTLRQLPRPTPIFDFVFTNRDGQPLNHKHILRKQFYPLLEKAGLPKIRMYDLRHTYATALARSNRIAPLTTSAAMGHVDPGFTLKRYSHGDQNMLAPISGIIESYLGGTQG